MKILRELYHLRASQLFARVECPTLLVPADPPADGARDPARQREREQAVAAAERALGGPPKARTVWMRETVHDIPLHRPAELAALLDELASA